MFQRTTFKQLGLRIQLGHGKRGQCYRPEKAVDDNFVIVDSHCIHEVGLDFCSCTKAKPCDIQLLRARLYPATGKNPRTAATFGMVQRFDLEALESKCSNREFYNSLSRATDNTGTEPVRVGIF
jgi:hypothetical protein